MIWRWFWREWRSPALLIVWLSLALAVACVLALGRIGDRIDKSIYAQSRDLIAGDLVLRASYPVDEDWLAEAKKGVNPQSPNAIYDDVLCARRGYASACFSQGR